MKQQHFCNFILAGVSITDFGLEIPSPFVSLSLSNSEITSMTSWTLTCTVAGSDTKQSNIASFEALLYSAAQAASGYENASGIPVSFAFGWLDSKGNVSRYISYSGFTLQFTVSTSGLYMTYEIVGFASLAMQSSMPVLEIPAVSGIVQPSAILEGLAKSVKATNYYNLDIDHNDAPTLIEHGHLTTSFNQYVRGTYSTEDDYTSFPGLVKLSKSYNGSRDAGGLKYPYKSVSQILNNVTQSPASDYFTNSITDETPQCASFSYWVDEPTMTQPGTIHYKSNAGLVGTYGADTLIYGTSESNVLSISGSYDGVAYNMSDMQFASVGYALDASGNTIVQDAKVVNSWSNSLADVYQTVNIINDVNAIASQFSGQFSVQIPGTIGTYQIAQPVNLVVMSGNTISPITGIYNVISVSHTIGDTFITTLELQRLTISTANQVASSQGIFISGSNNYPRDSYVTTSNIKSPYEVDFGDLYPTFDDIRVI